jgi:formylmethanofuran dehydrogenase subunit A
MYRRRTIAEIFNAHKNLTTDAGAMLFGETVTITADGPWQHVLHQLTGRKWATWMWRTRPVAGSFPTPTGDQARERLQWAVGLELMLLIDDPWRVFLTTDHPNGACFWRYPEIIRLLMDVEFRKEQIKLLPEEARKRIVLADLDRQYTLSEIAIISSAGPARALGLSQKGHLGVGADADVRCMKPGQRHLFEVRYVIGR